MIHVLMVFFDMEWLLPLQAVEWQVHSHENLISLNLKVCLYRIFSFKCFIRTWRNFYEVLIYILKSI